jgi:G patch domain/KOW motif-containing protein
VPGISVRVVDESWKGGRHFRRRGVVQDVDVPCFCQLLLKRDDRGDEVLLGDVPQSVLETALPRVGGRAFVVRGRNRGAEGEVLQRDGQRELLVLRSDSDGRAVEVRFDDVAEYAQPR